MRPLERIKNEALAALRRQVVKPLLDHELQEIRNSLKKQIKDSVKLGLFWTRCSTTCWSTWSCSPPMKRATKKPKPIGASTRTTAGRCSVNVVVDNTDRTGAPVIMENNPVFRALFGSIEFQAEEDVLMTDFTRIRAGSLLKAHGGFLLLHLRDLLADELVWEKLRRFLRSGRVQIEEPGTSLMPMATVSLEPEAVDADVKIVLIGSVEQYYALQEADPEPRGAFASRSTLPRALPPAPPPASHCRVCGPHLQKTLGACPIFPARRGAAAGGNPPRGRRPDPPERHLCPHRSPGGRKRGHVPRPGWQTGGSRRRGTQALAQRRLRHDYPEERLRESIAEGERLISCRAARGPDQRPDPDRPGRLALWPARAGHGAHPCRAPGLLNIEREVEMSGPIHDKGVLILHSYLTALFAHIAPLALNASVVFEQEYQRCGRRLGLVRRAVCAAVLLSGLPLHRALP
jgi:hypothetical protein